MINPRAGHHVKRDGAEQPVARQTGPGIGPPTCSGGTAGISGASGESPPVGIFFAVSATVCTGRRENSDIERDNHRRGRRAISVPAPQIRDAANDAAADATLAMISVCSEIRPPDRLSFRSALGSGDSTGSD